MMRTTLAILATTLFLTSSVAASETDCERTYFAGGVGGLTMYWADGTNSGYDAVGDGSTICGGKQDDASGSYDPSENVLKLLKVKDQQRLVLLSAEDASLEWSINERGVLDGKLYLDCEAAFSSGYVATSDAGWLDVDGEGASGGCGTNDSTATSNQDGLIYTVGIDWPVSLPY